MPSAVYISNKPSNVVYGVSQGPFKLNHAASVFRRRRGSNVIHLASAKPDVVSVFGLFQVVSENTDVPASGWHYQSHDQYLEMINLNKISGCLIPDPDYLTETGIPTAFRQIPVEEGTQHIFTTFHQTKVAISG